MRPSMEISLYSRVPYALLLNCASRIFSRLRAPVQAHTVLCTAETVYQQLCRLFIGRGTAGSWISMRCTTQQGSGPVAHRVLQEAPCS